MVEQGSITYMNITAPLSHFLPPHRKPSRIKFFYMKHHEKLKFCVDFETIR